MKKTFLEYNPLSKEIIKELWDNAIFVFDTNVLLNLYRYSDETSMKFLETISKLKEICAPIRLPIDWRRRSRRRRSLPFLPLLLPRKPQQ